MLTHASGRRHFWSPWMHIELQEQADGVTELFARFSPSPSIWTGFMLSYIALITTAFIAGCWGCAQWLIGEPPVLLWGVVVPVVIGCALAWFSRVGQRLARGEMEELRDAVLGALDVGGPTPGGDEAPGERVV